MKFAHLGDCHLGGWRQPELNQLNLNSFQKAIEISIKEKADFILIAGDLFDSPYPPIDILKEVFSEFRKIKEANIPVFLIAGSHDYSVSGKTFLDVLEKAGFCKNINDYEEREGKLILNPTIYKGAAIYGFPGKKSAMEVEEISRIKLQDSPGMFKILMLHTAIKSAVPNLPIETIDETALPKVDYLALGHLHIDYSKDNLAYSGPTFPNDIIELEELSGGSFYIFEDGKLKKNKIILKEVISFNIEIKNALTAVETILNQIKEANVSNKIVIIKLSGIIEQGKTSDIDFQRIEDELKKKGAFILLKSTTKLYSIEPDIKLDTTNSEQIESEIINNFLKTDQSEFNILISSLIHSLQAEKLDDENSSIFEERLLSECKKVINI